MLIEVPHEIKKSGMIILSIATPLLLFVWTYLEKVFPITTKQELMTIYIIQMVSTVLIIIFALLAFAIYLPIHLTKADNSLKKQLGFFIIVELDRLKKEREALIKRPPPSSPSVFSQYKEDGRFLDGQEEALLRFSRWLKPPDH